jgi:hypothetical protein
MASEEGKRRSSVHLPLDCLETIDLALHLPRTPGIAQGRANGREIGLHTLSEWETADPRLLHPGIQNFCLAMNDKLAKPLRQLRELIDFGTVAADLFEIGTLDSREILRFMEKEPHGFPGQVATADHCFSFGSLQQVGMA